LDDRVELVAGMLARDKFLESFARGDVLVLPFRLVPAEAPLAVLDAAGAHLPLVASAFPTIADLAAPGSVLVRPGDARDLAHAIDRLANDPTKREVMGRAAGMWHQAWPTWSETGAHLETLIRGLGPSPGPFGSGGKPTVKP
jgi:glycosyltransferase involved in cell wall biosynthesis